MKYFLDKKYRFVEMFDDKTGTYVRTGVLDDSMNDTGIDPFMRSFPALIDVGIMGSCRHAHLCPVGCYQGGEKNCKPNMSLNDFKRIVDECKGKTTQFALGGHGDPNHHENFEEILRYCREADIVPNFTTSGYMFTREHAALCKKYCGAVAVSYYNAPYTNNAIKYLLEEGVTTNIHYVLSKKSIKEAISILKGYRAIPETTENKVNAIIFLLHKPVGKGSREDMLSYGDPMLQEFFKSVEDNRSNMKIGFDSCTIPGIVNLTKTIDPASTDTCEGGRFSMYITPDMVALPCSFDNQDMRFAFDIKDRTIEDAWWSVQFEEFRKSLRNSCPGCKDRENCMGGCPLMRDIVLCNRETKKLI